MFPESEDWEYHDPSHSSVSLGPNPGKLWVEKGKKELAEHEMLISNHFDIIELISI